MARDLRDLVDVFSRGSLFDDEEGDFPPQCFSVEEDGRLEEAGWHVQTEVEKELPADAREFQKHFEGKKPSKKFKV